MIADDERLLLKIFYDYYVRNMSQTEIAERHHISRKKVQRLLDRGREENLVEVKIRFPGRMHGELESALEDKYDLLEALVSDADDDDPTNRAMTIRNAAEMAADYFLRVAAHDMIVSIAWSDHVAQTLEVASRKVGALREKPRNVAFVLTLGAVIGSDPDIQTLDAARRLSNALDGTVHALMTPSVATTADMRRALMEEPQIAEIMRRARDAGAAFFGVGSMEGDSRQLPMVRRLMPGIEDRLAALGAVGDINGHFFDANGEPVASELDDRLVGLDINEIKKLPLTVGVATGPRKYNAIKSLLKGRVLKVLVTDVENAKRLAAAEDGGLPGAVS